VVVALLAAGAVYVILDGGGGGGGVESTGERTNEGPVDEETVVEVTDPTEPQAIEAEPDGTVPVSTVPAQVIPTTLPPPVVTEAPVVTVAPEPTDVPLPEVPELVPGDLGLAATMTRPPCDDRYITVVASSLDPANDARVVADALARYPGSSYLKTMETCPSLRPSVDGAEIYVVYFGPFSTSSEACAARSSGPSDAYARILSLSVPDTHRVSC